jgi:hypothetical protein
MAGPHPNERLIQELVNEFRIIWSGPNTEFRMAEELIALNLVILDQEKIIEQLLKDRHLAFYREPPRTEAPHE